ncbi:MAG: replicative DNA helicase [Candidatus Berkelbacteria bacterium]|nr:replicative DNA helicase [Candidatus Berkelbacteria bacterium]
MPKRNEKSSGLTGAKLPPQNLEAESSVIGALLIDKEAILTVAEILAPEDFYDDRNATIYRAILGLFEKRVPLDLVTLTDRLEKDKELENVGGGSHIVSLVNSTPSSANVSHYANIVRDKAVLRRLITSAVTISDLGFDENEEVSAVLDKAEQSLFAVSQKFFRQKFIPIKDVLAEAFDRIDKIHKDKGALRGLPTGFRDLDSKLAGLQNADLLIIAARPSMGKTSLALNIAEHIAVEEKIPVAFFSLEMSKEQLVDRLISSQAGVDSWKLRTGNLSDSDFPKIGYAMGTLSEAPFFIDDSPGLTVTEIRTKARRLQMEQPLGVVFVDYLQLIESRTKSNDANRVQEISEISRSLKTLARELNIPVVAMSQLSRAVEHRPDKRPQLSDLRESGCLSGDTLVVDAKTGTRTPIKNLVGKNNLKILALNSAGKFSPLSASKIFSTGRKKVFEILLTSGKKIKATANHKFLTIDGWKRLDKLSIGNDKLATIDEKSKISEVLGAEAIWDKIKKITPLGVEEVFDITVPGEHNFVANDIVVHNSIEQDADVVMFIYRDDYYDENSEKKGVTEILIRKHRNGPIGNVALFFNAEQMRFRDLAKQPKGISHSDFGPED